MLAPYVTERGYAFVVQDVRGKFRSEGETVPFIHEVEDGYDTLEWVAAQSWSDGSVVTFGDSYYGFTQWAAVASGHPALRAIVPRVTSADLATFNWSGEGVTALYGADYLAHYWVDNPIYDFPVDWSVDRWPASTTKRSRPSGRARAASICSSIARCAEGPARIRTPAGIPSTGSGSPCSTRSGGSTISPPTRCATTRPSSDVRIARRSTT